MPKRKQDLVQTCVRWQTPNADKVHRVRNFKQLGKQRMYRLYVWLRMYARPVCVVDSLPVYVTTLLVGNHRMLGRLGGTFWLRI